MGIPHHTGILHAWPDNIMLVYAMSFASIASAEHPNIVLCKIFEILMALHLEAVSLQWSDPVA